MSQAAKYQAQIASNPLLQGLPSPWSPDQWTNTLIQHAFEPEDYPLAVEDPNLVEMMDSLFVPTSALVSIAASIHKLLWNSLVQRDPRYVRKDGTRLPRVPGAEAPYDIRMKPRGLLIQGITHLGKSTIVSRTLEQFPKFIDREADWPGVKSVRQLVWLKVESPLGVSLSAFISALADAIGASLGTSVGDQLRRRAPSDDFIKLLSILREHYCGVLVIDEGQPENKLEGQGGAARAGASGGRGAASTAPAPSLAKLFMDVMNAGIGVILVGNPLAFTKVLAKSQLGTRLADNCHHLHPALSHEQDEWRLDYLPGIWNVSFFPKEDEEYPGLARKLWVKTGGFHHALILLRKVALLHALAAGADRVRKVDADAALNHDLGEQTNLFRIFAARDSDRLKELPDVPDDYAMRWKALEGKQTDQGAPSAPQVKTRRGSDEPSEAVSAAPVNDALPLAQPKPLPRARAKRTPSEAVSAQDLRSEAAQQRLRAVADKGEPR